MKNKINIKIKKRPLFSNLTIGLMLGCMLGCKWREDYMLARSQKSFL